MIPKVSSYSAYLSELHTLGTIPPNTFVHENREGRLIPTADSASPLIGSQSVANYFKGHSPENTARSISTFAEKLLEALANDSRQAKSCTPENKWRLFRNFIYVNQQIIQAIQGKIKDGGLNGIVETYSFQEAVGQSLKESILKLQTMAFYHLQVVRDQLPEAEEFSDKELQAIISYKPSKAIFCAEENYSNEEWDEAIARSADLRKEYVGLFKYYFRFAGGLLYNQTQSVLDSARLLLLGDDPDPHWSWWNKIGRFEGAELFISALPVKTVTANTLEEMQREGVESILSVVEVFENLAEGYITSSVTPDDYKAHGIKQLQLPTPDCETIPIPLILRGVEFIHWNLSQNRSCCVHCKAGRGRSALVSMCYLIKYHHMTAEAAFALVKEKRPQAGFSQASNEWATLKKFESLYYKNIS